MPRIALLIILSIPGLANAGMWRWVDAGGQLHYSNVPGHVPAGAATLHRQVGYISPAPLPAAAETAWSDDTDRLRQERALRRRLDEIEAFYASVRARQIARLQSYATSTLLPDWLLADQWLRLKDEEQVLRHELARLERQKDSSS